MKYIINEEICEKNDLTIEELLALLLVKTGVKIPEVFKNLLDKQYIQEDMFNELYLTNRSNDLIATILLDSDKEVPQEDRIEKIAIALQDIFPKMKKEGTCHYFRGNKKEVTLRLKKFFKVYGHYSDEQILNAAKNYVESFNGNYSYMRILKYFIWKDEVKMNSEGERYVSEASDLANWIENAGQEDSNKQDWTSTLI